MAAGRSCFRVDSRRIGFASDRVGLGSHRTASGWVPGVGGPGWDGGALQAGGYRVEGAGDQLCERRVERAYGKPSNMNACRTCPSPRPRPRKSSLVKSRPSPRPLQDSHLADHGAPLVVTDSLLT